MKLLARSVFFFLSPAVLVVANVPTSFAVEVGLIAADDFTYPFGDLNGSNGGPGWTSTWTRQDGSIGVDENRAFAVGQVATHYTRTFPPTPVGADVYFSARVIKIGGDTVWAQMVRLYVGGEIEDQQSASLGLANNDRFLTRAGPVSSQVEFGSFQPGEVHQLVGKVEFDEVGGTHERVTVWVDPTDVETSLVSSVAVADYTSREFADTVSLRGFLLDDSAIHWDDVRIGTTWEGVLSANGASAALSLLPRGSAWSYLDTVKNQLHAAGALDYPTDTSGRDWHAVDFDVNTSADRTRTPLVELPWRNDSAPFGAGAIGDLPIATQLQGIDDAPNGESNDVTTYLFRREFESPDPSVIRELRVNLLSDDGGVLYINGQEVFRTPNMPEGPITTTTLAEHNASEFYSSFLIDGIGALRTGTNSVAFELHQTATTSSDVGFDLELVAFVIPEPSALLLLAFGAFAFALISRPFPLLRFH